MMTFSRLLFLFLILLNTFGYYPLLLVIEYELCHRSVTKITENQDEIGGNLLLRLPVALPYRADDNEYRSAKGEIVVDGILYHLVKQKFFRDTLYVLCVKDPTTTEVRNTIANYAGTFAQTDHEKPDTPARAVGLFLMAMFISRHSSYEPNSQGWTMTLARTRRDNLYRYSSTTSVFHPPCWFFA